jgi:DNA polymerase III epsilon subunit-like protein
MLTAIFDLETTGLVENTAIVLDKQPRIIEFYGCVVDFDGEMEDELSSLIDPGIELDKTVTKITGITNEMLKGKPTFAEFLPLVSDFFLGADAVVAHNLIFDRTVMNFELQRNGVNPALFWPERQICTLESTEYLKGYRLSLQKLHEHLFVEGFSGAHRARMDVVATTRCFFELQRRGMI